MGWIGRRRRMAPGKIFVIEFHEGEMVRLEIRHPGARLGAHDEVRIDADDIAGADELKFFSIGAPVVTPSLIARLTRMSARLFAVAGAG